MIVAESISYRIRGRTILDAISLTLVPGEFCIVVGPNGAGKSTLLRLLSGESHASAGTVTYAGRDVRSLGAAELALKRGVMPQASSLAFPFTVAEVVRLGLRAGVSGVSRAEAEELPARALAAVDMSAFAARTYQELSGGEKQRVQLARVLCQIWSPVMNGAARALFLDEPTASLDLHHQLATVELARDYARRGGIALAILHDLNLAACYADRMIALDEGRIAANGRPEDVVTDDLLKQVFQFAGRVNTAPAGGAPYVLPHSAVSAA